MSAGLPSAASVHVKSTSEEFEENWKVTAELFVIAPGESSICVKQNVSRSCHCLSIRERGTERHANKICKRCCIPQSNTQIKGYIKHFCCNYRKNEVVSSLSVSAIVPEYQAAWCQQ